MIPLLSLERQMLMINEKIYKNYQKNVKILYSKDYMFLLGLMYFISHDGFQNMFVYQPTFSMMNIKTQILNILLVGNQKESIILSILHQILIFCWT